MVWHIVYVNFHRSRFAIVTYKFEKIPTQAQALAHGKACLQRQDCKPNSKLLLFVMYGSILTDCLGF